jgi:diguanylate cyclase (GGDEF)-like protein
MNKLTKRLLKRNLKEGFDLDSISKLVDAFSETIDQYEQDRLMLERSLMLTSDELNEINDTLRHRITEIQNNQDLLKHQAYHDSLTALPNRINIMNTIHHALALAKRHQQKCAILFIDLDDFKKINDTAGHSEGDRFLIEVSQRLKSILRESDTLGRLGGDEFIIILENIASGTQITEVYSRALKSLSTPFIIGGNPYVVSCSIGISNFPQDGKTVEELIRKADMAMYQAKKLGKNRFHYFDESLERLAIHRVKTEESLREAIKNNEFILYYQPKIQINQQQEKLVGVEALIRWKKEDGTLIYPDSFIPIAEKCGLIKNITKWVITEACKQLKQWKNTSLANIPISVNISAIDAADHGFVDSTLSILETFDTPGHLINLELTESVFFDDIDTVNIKLEELRKNNITISLDDFGTGYSSLSYIQDLQIDFLKIDKSFIFGMSKNNKSLAIVQSIIDMGNNLGLTVIAEGVETNEDKEILINAECHIAQGYLYSRPIEASKLEEFYRE